MSMELDTREFVTAMRQLTKETGVEAHTVMRWQMGLWVRDIILKIYGDPSESIAQQKKLGEARIYGELLGTKSGDRPLFQGFTDKADPKDMGRKFYAMKLKGEKGGFYLVDKEHFWPRATTDDLAVLHKMNRKNGHVSVSGPASRMAFGLFVSNVYTVPARTLKAYIKMVQAQVGKAKSTWLKAYEHFKSAAGMNLLPWSAPSWIQRHGKTAWDKGVWSDTFDKETLIGEWTAGSDGDYGIKPQEALDRTWPTRVKDLSGGHALKRLKGRIEKFNAREARAA